MENPTLGFGLLNVRKSGICRLCMKAHEYYLNIFVSNEEFKTSISKAIEDLLVLKVAKDDNLPKIVCCQCVTKLMEFREFKEMCMNSAREFGRHAQVEPITCPVKDEFLPMQLLGVATSGTWSNCVDGESGVPITPNDLSPNPFDLENQSDTKEVYPRDRLGESDEGGQEDFAKTESNEDASVCSESKQILMDAQGEVKEELESTELVGNVESHSREIIDGGDSSDTGGPILLSDILAVMGMRYAEEDSRPTELIVKEEIGEGLECSENDMPVLSLAGVNVDHLAVDTMVDRCNNIGRLTEELEKEFGKFGADRQGISQDKLLNDSSFDPVCEENLQLEYSMPNHFVADYFPEKMVTKQKKNLIFGTSSKEFSQVNDRASPVRNQECEQFCHQSENTSYPTHYICNYCSTSYSQKNSLARHIKRHVDGKKSAIVLPKKEFPPRFSQYLLEKDRGNVEPVIVGTSNMSFTQKSSRRKNEKPAVEESSRGENLGRELCNIRKLFLNSVNPRVKAAFVCDTCGIEFMKKYDLVQHVNVHTGLISCRYQQKGNVTLTYFKPLRCDLCGKYFKNTKTLKRHSVTHTGKKSFKCNECGKIFTRKGNLKTHSVLHTGVKAFKCNECGKVFACSSNLKSHSIVHTGVKAFKCNECGKMFACSSNLKSHSIVHTGVKAFKCNECGKMFAYRSNLKKHSIVHTGVKAFKCNDCGKMFARKNHLQRHSVVHTDEGPFKCNECSKMFTSSSKLKMHSVVHTGVKKFKCKECGKMFPKSDDLIDHSVVHTGVKPFKCNECGKLFTQRSTLKKHLRIHSGVVPFKCDFCGKQFKWRSGFKRHLITHADRNPSK